MLKRITDERKIKLHFQAPLWKQTRQETPARIWGKKQEILNAFRSYFT